MWNIRALASGPRPIKYAWWLGHEEIEEEGWSERETERERERERAGKEKGEAGLACLHFGPA